MCGHLPSLASDCHLPRGVRVSRWRQKQLNGLWVAGKFSVSLNLPSGGVVNWTSDKTGTTHRPTDVSGAFSRLLYVVLYMAVYFAAITCNGITSNLEKELRVLKILRTRCFGSQIAKS